MSVLVVDAGRPDAPARIAAALRAGVRVFVDADAAFAPAAAARGDLLVAPALRDAFVAALTAPDPFPGLSGRAREVLVELAAGADAGRIAVRLGLARKTVRHHLVAIRRELGVADDDAAARLARSAGL